MRTSLNSRWPLAAPLMILAAGTAVVLMACAEAAAPEAGALCHPDESIFCRCPGGAPGTKQCLSSGNSFGDCGPCEDRTSEPGSSTTGSGSSSSTSGEGAAMSTSSSGSGGSGTGGSGTGGSEPVPGIEPLLAPCSVDTDCQSLMCRYGYCTKICAQVSECPWPQSECIPVDVASTFCMPTCKTAVDCVAFKAPPSQCGYTKAVDNWGVTTCANWGDQHQLAPQGTDCTPFDHPACNLGYQQTEWVCTAQGVCDQGCFTNADCPASTTCSGQGAQGNCVN